MGSEQEAMRGWKEKTFCVSQSVSLSLSSSPFRVVLSHSVRLPRPSLWIFVYLPLSPSFVSFPFRWLGEVFVFHFEHRLFVPPVKSYLTFTPSEITPFFFSFSVLMAEKLKLPLIVYSTASFTSFSLHSFFATELSPLGFIVSITVSLDFFCFPREHEISLWFFYSTVHFFACVHTDIRNKCSRAHKHLFKLAPFLWWGFTVTLMHTDGDFSSVYLSNNEKKRCCRSSSKSLRIFSLLSLSILLTQTPPPILLLIIPHVADCGLVDGCRKHQLALMSDVCCSCEFVLLSLGFWR